MLGGAAAVTGRPGGRAEFATSRWFQTNNVYELRSIYERERDALIAIDLMGTHPLGVGVTNYLPVAQQQDPNPITVHNSFLLTGV